MNVLNWNALWVFLYMLRNKCIHIYKFYFFNLLNFLYFLFRGATALVELVLSFYWKCKTAWSQTAALMVTVIMMHQLDQSQAQTATKVHPWPLHPFFTDFTLLTRLFYSLKTSHTRFQRWPAATGRDSLEKRVWLLGLNWQQPCLGQGCHWFWIRLSHGVSFCLNLLVVCYNSNSIPLLAEFYGEVLLESVRYQKMFLFNAKDAYGSVLVCLSFMACIISNTDLELKRQ